MARRDRVDLTVSKLRSAITNGRFVLPEVDHRSASMRRLRDLIFSHTSDLGGEDYISESERRLIRRAAMLTLQLEMLDQRFANIDGAAKAADLELYQRGSNTLRRLLETLGLQRRPRDVSPPSLSQYLSREADNLDAEEA